MAWEKGQPSPNPAGRPRKAAAPQIDPRLLRLFERHPQYHDTPARSARMKAMLKRVRPELSGRIGKIEKLIARVTIMTERDWTTAELAQEVYAHPTFDQDFRFRDGKPPPKLKSWMYHRIRLAAPAFCDRVGRSTAKGAPWLWRAKPDLFYCDVRNQKRVRDAERLKGRRSKE